MKLSYVTVCVNYLDYLQVTLPHNRAGGFNEYVVVTAPQDKATQAFCAQEGLTCVVTDAFYRDGAIFNKGLAINEGFKALKYHDWVCFMDSDTFMPVGYPGAAIPSLDKEWMYGMRRVMVRSYADYLALVKGEKTIDDFECPLGAGYGFAQLFHWDSEPIRRAPYGQWYPSYPDCTESDWRFRNKFGDYAEGSHYTIPIGRFAELPFRVINLGVDGQNHKGRLSPAFG